MNNNNSILLVDPDFDQNAIASRNLLFKITADSFSFAILNTEAGRLEVLYDQQDCDPAVALAERMSTDLYLSLDFQHIKTAVCSPNTLIIPDSLYQPDAPGIYANYFTELADYSETLYANAHTEQTFKTLFLLPKQIDLLLQDSKLSNSEKYGQTAALLAMVKSAVGNQLILDFTGGSFYVLLFKAGSLAFQNYYTIENEEEFTYYLLLIVQQLGIQATEIAVVATGIINEGDGRFEILQRYFQSVTILEPTLEGTDLTLLDDMPKHYYTSLLGINLCA